jgi:hypothetical protein
LTDQTADDGSQQFSLPAWLLGEILAFAEPLRETGGSPTAAAALLTQIGWDASALPPLIDALQQAVPPIETAITTLYTLAAPPDGSEPAASMGTLQSLLSAAQGISQAIKQLSSIGGISNPPAQLPQLGEDLLAWLTDDYLRRTHPPLRGISALLGLLVPQELAPQQSPVTDASGHVLRSACQVPELHLDRLGAFLQDPQGYLRQTYIPQALATTGAVQAASDAIFPLIADALQQFGIGANYGLDPYFDLALDASAAALLQHSLSLWMPDSGEGDRMGATLALVAPDESAENKLAAVIAPLLPAGTDTSLSGWTLTLQVTAAGSPLAVVGWTPLPADTASWPGFSFVLTLATGAWTETTSSPASPPHPSARLRVTVSTVGSAFDALVSLTMRANTALGSAEFSDGFLQSVLPSGGLNIPLDLTLSIGRGGCQLTGSAVSGKTIVLATLPSASIGPLAIEQGHIEVVPADGNLTVAGYLTASVSIGPLTATVQDIGIGGTVSWPSGGGNAGPLDLQPEMLWPSGIGLGIEASVVSGVGFLSYDQANARYLGALALSLGDISISAVGVLDTRLPGGAHGYSLVVVASATFPPIELGFGFSLAGIGGAVGMHRTVDVPSLQALARAGRLDDLMFPADLAHRAPQVAANLAQVFPPAQDHFLIGPAVRIEWGVGGMLDAEIGVFIELSDSGGGINVLRVALLGWIHLALPDALTPLPLVDLKLDVLGLVDFPAKTLSLDAGLRDSTIASFPLTGQAALRAGWGPNAAFVLAIGGFNPHFAAPAGFPTLQRVTLSIGSDNPRLTLAAYLAATSNTVQFGCSADLYASEGSAAVSASLSFDAVVQRKPFGVIADLSVTATALLDGNPVLTLNLDLHLTGPGPWTVTGSASFHILFCSHSVPVNITVGPQPPPQAPETVDLDGNLFTALTDPHSWQTGPPPGRGVVAVRGQDAAHPAVHPLGSLTVRQHAVPLGQRVDRYGPDLLDPPCRYDITGSQIGGQPAPRADVSDFFAPAQFLTMSDADKLSSPSFEQMTAGSTLGSASLSVPATAGATSTVADTVSSRAWDTLILDSPDPTTTTVPSAATASTASGAASPGTVTLPDTLLAAQRPGAAVAVNGATGRGQALYAGPGSGIAVEQPSFAVVGMNLLGLGRTRTVTLGIPSRAAALSAPPAAADGEGWQVVYKSEVP